MTLTDIENETKRQHLLAKFRQTKVDKVLVEQNAKEREREVIEGIRRKCDQACDLPQPSEKTTSIAYIVESNLNKKRRKI